MPCSIPIVARQSLVMTLLALPLSLPALATDDAAAQPPPEVAPGAATASEADLAGTDDFAEMLTGAETIADDDFSNMLADTSLTLDDEDFAGSLAGTGDEVGLTPELQMFEDMPVVISASRQAQPVNLTSAPVGILTAEDIHYSGIDSLAELLLFMQSIDVLLTDRNNAAVGVRGLHHPFADRTLFLIDGRAAGSPVFGGADLFRLPIFPEDIARIEVVRGPGGAAWGANAFNGVVNFIMKEPEDVLGVFGSVTVNEYGDVFSQLRWGHELDAWSWRVSAGYEDRESSDDAVSGDTFFSNDFARNFRFDSQVNYEPDTDTTLSFGASAAHIDRGDFEFAGFPGPFDPRSDERLDVARFYARLDKQLDPDSSFYVQWFGNYEDVNRPTLWRLQSLQNDIEGQYNANLGDVHDLSVGGNVRWDRIDVKQSRPTDVLPPGTRNEYWLGAFVIDRWHVREGTNVEIQGRLDWYSETTLDWSGRLTFLQALDDDEQHVLRLAAARSFRAPPLAMRETGFGRVPLPPPAPPGLFGISLLPSGDLDNESIISLEAGYHGRVNEHFSWGIDGYYQFYDDLIGARPVPVPPGLPVQVAQLDNIGGADAWGLEPNATLSLDPLTLTAWYSYNDFSPDQENQSIRAFRPPVHSVGITGRLSLPDDWTVNLNYRYTDTTVNDPLLGGDVQISHRIDLTVAKAFGDGAVELMVGVRDLLDDTDIAIAQLGSLTAHETPGRTFFFRGQVRF